MNLSLENRRSGSTRANINVKDRTCEWTWEVLEGFVWRFSSFVDHANLLQGLLCSMHTYIHIYMNRNHTISSYTKRRSTRANADGYTKTNCTDALKRNSRHEKASNSVPTRMLKMPRRKRREERSPSLFKKELATCHVVYRSSKSAGPSTSAKVMLP